MTVCSHNGRRYAAGAVWASTGRRRCAEFECGEDGAVTTTWCNNIMAGPTCRMVRGNASAPFPGCCPPGADWEGKGPSGNQAKRAPIFPDPPPPSSKKKK